MMIRGAAWAVEQGYGRAEHLEATEDHGCIPGADPSMVSERARERGLEQIGTLGSGNHFLELGVVEEIYHPEAAAEFGLETGGITFLIHTGSRGFGQFQRGPGLSRGDGVRGQLCLGEPADDHGPG